MYCDRHFFISHMLHCFDTWSEIAFLLAFRRCDITYILLEMDRILRPEGTVIFRDTVDVLVKIKSITDGMRWKSQIMDHESGPFNPEKILVAVKTYWTGKPSQKQL